MVQFEQRFSPFAAKMEAEHLPELAIKSFEQYYRQLVAGETGYLAESDITPIRTLPDADEFDDKLAEVGRAAIHRTVMLKLNGGLGTGMGMQKAKSLLPVKVDLSFLDSIVLQAVQIGIPLILMNSLILILDFLTENGEQILGIILFGRQQV